MKKHLFFSILVFGLLASVSYAVVYVKPGGTGDGSSWENAMGDLQIAINSASYGDQVWVAEGTYKPDPNDLADPREASFRMKNGLEIYGGFAGTETALEQREAESHKTILSGDLAGNDDSDTPVEELATDPNRIENCYHVFCHPKGMVLDPNSILDGFIMTNGNANKLYPNNSGGGMFVYESNPTIINCIFIRNSASYGGGMHNAFNSVTVIGCTFSGNSSTHGGGGGMCNIDSRPTVIDCIFSKNVSHFGGGIRNSYGNPIVVNCTFISNLASGHGGGVINDRSSPTITGCIFNKNTATYGSGGMANYDSSNPDITNCTFIANRVDLGSGGGVCNDRSSPNVTNCTFIANRAFSNGGGLNNWGSSSTVSNCIFWGNNPNQISNVGYPRLIVTYCDIAGSGGSGSDWDFSLGFDGGGNIDIDPLFVDPNGLDGIIGTEDDNLHLLPWSPCIDAGDPAGDYSGQTDMDGENRVLYDAVDMGADEVFPIAGDIDEDGDVDLTDFSYFAAHWLKGM